jgi:hypothetical protein
MNWHEEIPDNCPPNDSELPEGRTFYRLCKNIPADNSDFCSQLHDSPSRKFSGISTCILRSVSIWDDKEKCIQLKKLKTQRNKVLGAIVLNDEDGLVKNTFKPNHYSCWRSDRFNPSSATIIE